MCKHVVDNFYALFVGAIRLEGEDAECQTCESDYYAPGRIQVGQIRLHEIDGIKEIGCWSCRHEHYKRITEDMLLDSISVINILANVARKEIKSKLDITICLK